MSRICPACSTANDPDATACSTCGEELAVRPADLPVERAHEHHAAARLIPFVAPGLDTPAVQTDVPQYQPTFSGGMLDDPRHLEGISGWLLLVALSVIATPVVLAVTMFRSYAPMLQNPDAWNLLQDRPNLRTLVVSEAATNAVSLLITLVLVYLFFAKKKSFPAVEIFYLVLHAAAMVADLVFTYVVVPTTAFRAQDLAAAGRSILLCLLLIPYLIVSRRVKATFVN